MNKLLQHIMSAGDVSDKFLPLLEKYQVKGQVTNNPLLRVMPRSTGDISSLPGVRIQVPLSKQELESNRIANQQRKIAEDARIIAERKARIKASEEARKRPFSAQQLADETQAIGDKLRLFPNDPDSFFDEYLNPGVYIGNMASALGRAPLNIQQGNYGDAAMSVATPLVLGAAETLAAPFINKGVSRTTNYINTQVAPRLGRAKSYISNITKGKQADNLLEVVDPETGVSSFVPKNRPASSGSATKYGRDDQGVFSEIDGRRTYFLEPAPSEITLGQDVRRPLTNLTEQDYNTLLKKAREANVRQQYMGATQYEMADLNNRSVDLWRGLQNRNYDIATGMSSPVSMLRMQRSLGNSINSGKTYQDALNSMIRAYIEEPPSYNWGTANWNVTNNRSALDKLTSLVGNKLNRLDERLGRMVYKTKEVPDYNPDQLLNTINENLARGMGIKKSDLPLEIRFSNSGPGRPYTGGGIELFPGSGSSVNKDYLALQTFVQGQPVGSINLQRNIAPFVQPKSLSQILFGNRTNNARTAWENTMGFKKVGDFPFNNYSGQNPIQDLSGKTFSGATDFYNLGLSGEFNKAINEALKSRGLGNILSGGTGHSALGASRWENLVKKGIAHKFGDDPSQSYYMIKKKGGIIEDDAGQWNNPGDITRIRSKNITMQGVPYPVLAVPNKGKGGMMYPGENYFFPKADYVDEYPIMRRGGQAVNQDFIGYTLPEVTVYGHRNPTAKAYFDRWRKEAESWQDREEPVNTPMASYLAAEQLYNKYKGRNINIIDKDVRPTYNPFSDTLNIVNPEDDRYGDTFLEELAHKVQKNNRGAFNFAIKHLTKDLPGTLKNINLTDIFDKEAWRRAYENNYFTPGTQEYEAHTIIQPKLKEEFNKILDKEYERLVPSKKMQKGGTNPYKEVDAFNANLLRTLLPVPKNLAQMTAKILGDARMNNNSLDDDEKLILWNTIKNAQKRSGIPSGGGTEYSDYGNQGYGTSQEFNNWFNRGKVGFLKGAYNSLTNPGFTLASTIGRGRYWEDPKDSNTIYYTDVYDWNPSERNFSGKNAYQYIRNFLRNNEDKQLNRQKNDMYRMNFKLTKKEIDDIKKRKETDMQGTLGLGLFKGGGQHGGLDRWFAEKWVDVKTGKTCGRQEGESRAYPACRPSRRVSSETPKTSSEMSPSEKAKFKRTKTSSQRIPYNHKRK